MAVRSSGPVEPRGACRAAAPAVRGQQRTAAECTVEARAVSYLPVAGGAGVGRRPSLCKKKWCFFLANLWSRIRGGNAMLVVLGWLSFPVDDSEPSLAEPSRRQQDTGLEDQHATGGASGLHTGAGSYPREYDSATAWDLRGPSEAALLVVPPPALLPGWCLTASLELRRGIV